MNLVEGHLDDFLIGQLFLHVEEVVHELADVPDCIGQHAHPLTHHDVLRGLADCRIHEELRSLEDVLVVFGLVEEGEGLVVELDVPVYLRAHPIIIKQIGGPQTGYYHMQQNERKDGWGQSMRKYRQTLIHGIIRE